MAEDDDAADACEGCREVHAHVQSRDPRDAARSVVVAVQELWSDTHFRVGPIAFLFSHLSWISTMLTACYCGSLVYSSWAVVVVAIVLSIGVIAMWVVTTSVMIPQYLKTA